MPAARATANRQKPAFKPPRPRQAQASDQSADASSSAALPEKLAANRRRSTAAVPYSKQRGPSGFRTASKAIEVSDDEDHSSTNDGAEGDRLESEDEQSDTGIPAVRSRVIQSPASPSAVAPIVSQDAPPPIPQKLLTRLLHEGFDDSKTRIGKDAMAVIGKYMELFVREAIARAAAEREEADAGAGDGFLEVEDLEKLAPQLLLDF
ncbi:MAG: hypothetical protein M1820_005317 [Bogoriella megaspora]|nr:MAG: hypothetical protein M1820_005317 [Bogoriella megaspora]